MAASGGGGNASGGRESDDDESDDYELTPRKKKGAFSVPAELYNRMYAHQRIGVRWLWSLHQGDMGGILGDDMGLGKTFQVTCFLAGLFGTRQAKSALVLAPKSVMRGWEDELGRWLVRAACPKAEVVVMASEMPAKARRRAIALAAEGGSRGRGAVLITTYGMVSSNPKQFAPAVGGSGGWIEREEPRKHVWDYVILDEGHKIKNASTKTPVQNNLKELHTVVDWATFGKLLGPYKYFKKA
ncbi:excision repair helicase ercc-6-related [Ectocarpus siliculosus]|uniref:Excision repair helicase ercc-6-related n=1 Tax=Ectocarpus siliculosus TaxID=2880 RepID=D8LM38_ECTSI|nr:excision repair helicase ercc-6-related [Ectocarpus siliculosus]|eukprot:CBN76186.1 excision repair helicase ercc-6-related [Ectocarpus siliculosus]